MEIIKNIFDLNKAIKDFKDCGFVPTMGGLHQGHISLIKNSQKMCKKTIVSIFVNPTQFNDKNDYKKYPRNLVKDIKILKKLKVDFLFTPKISEIYKKKTDKIKIYKKDRILCAKYRKGHFEGVLNVMSRLLSFIKVKNVFLGEKDFQQIFLINKYLSKKYNIKIINCPIIRDKNKIALSTRNNLLDNKSYKKATFIIKNLFNFKKKVSFKTKNHYFLLKKNIKLLEKNYNIKIDYLELRNEINLSKYIIKKKMRLFIAYYLGNVRLIDNIKL